MQGHLPNNPNLRGRGGDFMAQMSAAEKKSAAKTETYISRVWLDAQDAPKAAVSSFNGKTAKVFRVVGGTGPHTILYIRDLDPNTVL